MKNAQHTCGVLAKDGTPLGQRISRISVYHILIHQLLNGNKLFSQIIRLCFCWRLIQPGTHILHRNKQTGSPYLSVTKKGPKLALSTHSSPSWVQLKIRSKKATTCSTDKYMHPVRPRELRAENAPDPAASGSQPPCEPWMVKEQGASALESALWSPRRDHWGWHRYLISQEFILELQLHGDEKRIGGKWLNPNQSVDSIFFCYTEKLNIIIYKAQKWCALKIGFKTVVIFY